MISVYVPAYNEAAVLAQSVRQVVTALEGMEFEVTIVDDSSTDSTARVAENLASSDPRIKSVRYEGGPTRRENLAASFKQARGDVIAFIDADLSASPNNIIPMVDMLRDFDIVVGSRYAPGSKTSRSALRLLYSRVAAAFTRLYFNSSLHDYQCGLKVFKHEVILRLVEEAGYDRSMRRGFAWDTEILLRAQRRGYKIAEYPVEWTESGRSSVKPMRDWHVIPYVISLRGRI